MARNVLPHDHPHGMFLVSAYTPSYAPEGQSQMCHFCSADRNTVPNVFNMNQAKVWVQMKEFFTLFEENLKIFYPDLEKHILWRMYHVGAYAMAEEPGIGTIST